MNRISIAQTTRRLLAAATLLTALALVVPHPGAAHAAALARTTTLSNVAHSLDGVRGTGSRSGLIHSLGARGFVHSLDGSRGNGTRTSGIHSLGSRANGQRTNGTRCG